MSLRVTCCTWNVYGQPPGDQNLHQWLNLSENDAPDVCIIGLQEVSADPQSLLLDYYIRTDPWTKRLKLYMGSRGLVVVEVLRMMGLLLVVAARSVHLPFIRQISKSHVRTALWGLLPLSEWSLPKWKDCLTGDVVTSVISVTSTDYLNIGLPKPPKGSKGALGIRFELYGETFCFVNAHFTSGDGYVDSRNLDFNTITSKLIFTVENNSLKLSDHRYTFFIGDLNYRIDSFTLEQIKGMLTDGNVKQLLEKDELALSKAKGSAFTDYLEMGITHPPTYKYNLSSSEFDTSVKARKPAWCDRVLWHEKQTEELTVSPVSYHCHMGYTISDHKPVSANFDVINQIMTNSKPTVEFRFDPSFVPWNTEEDGVCVFHVFGYKTSSWDWIGLYRLDFNNAYDYFTYEWSVTGADETGEDGCMVLFDDVPDEPGFYMFGYFSRKLQCFLGISEPFEVILQPEEPQEVTVDVPQPENPPNNI